MNKIFRLELSAFIVVLFFGIVISCNGKGSTNPQDLPTGKKSDSIRDVSKKYTSQLSSEFKDYWYAGSAEITSYKLEQARYGEIRDGEAVLIYVTEPFLPKVQVKADGNYEENIPVLKLNATKNFNTGIYPYSIMQSVFYPIANAQHALKVSCSVQEWCGHVYSQLNNRDQFEITSHSYFEGEADEEFTLEKDILENELWTQLRIDPKSLPTGTLEIIPSLEFIRLKHIELKAYKVSAERSENSYTLSYPELNRSLTIHYEAVFPYKITGWEEQVKSGYDDSAQVLITKATRLKTIQSEYWTKKRIADENLRETLQLK